MSPLEFGGAPMITVENDNGEVVLVDYRSQTRAIGVDGPVAFTLAPGTAVSFAVPVGQTFCVRVIRPERQQVTASAGLVSRRGDTPARVRVRAVERSGGSASSPCPSNLADHRVRLSLVEYFEPHDPGSVRRERLLNRH